MSNLLRLALHRVDVLRVGLRTLLVLGDESFELSLALRVVFDLAFVLQKSNVTK